MRTLGFIVAAFLVSSELAIAQPQDTRRAPIDIAVRVNGPVYVEAGDSSPSVLVINSNAIPALIFTGCVVSGAAIGHYAVRRFGWQGVLPETRRETLIATALGLGLLQVAALVPALGIIVVVLASVAGAGAVAYRAWTRMEARHA